MEIHDRTHPASDPRNIHVICPPELRTNVIEMYHTRGHCGIRKTSDAIRQQYCWQGAHDHVAEFITRHCSVYVEKQKANLKEGVHVPRVIHDQGEVVYIDLVFDISIKRMCT